MLKFMGWEVVPPLLERRRLSIFDEDSYIVASERDFHHVCHSPSLVKKRSYFLLLFSRLFR